MEPYIGEIRVFAGNFAPPGWLFCQGQILKISEFDTLFALIGTSYGGDGQSNFALPNLSSRVVVGQGPLPGGGNYQLAQQMGVETVLPNGNQLPTHSHPFAGTIGVPDGPDRDQKSPVGSFFGSNGGAVYSPKLGTADQLGDGAVVGQSNVVGSGQPHPNIQPVLAVNYIICTQGLYPSQP